MTRQQQRDDALARPDQALVASGRRRVAWMGMALHTPRDWEIIRHATGLDNGRLAWVDRRRQRLVLSWARTTQRPDLAQAIADYKAMDREDHGSLAFTNLRAYPGWKGYWRQGLTRLTRYERDRHLWIELTIPWHGDRDAALEAELVQTFELLAPPPSSDDEQPTRARWQPTLWRAFGLDVTAPAGWMLDVAAVKPADVQWTFSDVADGRRSVEIARMGMIDVWYAGDLRQVIRERVGYGPEMDFRETRWDDTPAWSAESTIVQKRWKNIVGGPRRRVDVAWVDRAAHSVICVTATGPRSAAPEPQSFAVQGYSVQ